MPTNINYNNSAIDKILDTNAYEYYTNVLRKDITNLQLKINPRVDPNLIKTCEEITNRLDTTLQSEISEIDKETIIDIIRPFIRVVNDKYYAKQNIAELPEEGKNVIRKAQKHMSEFAYILTSTNKFKEEKPEQEKKRIGEYISNEINYMKSKNEGYDTHNMETLNQKIENKKFPHYDPEMI
jgi:hypothetical protein